MFVGIVGAYYYMQILDYRRLHNEFERTTKYPKLDKLHRSNLIQAFIYFIGLIMCWVSLTIGKSAISDPYSWSMSANITYFCLTRVAFSGGNFLMLYVIFLSGFTFGKTLLSRPLFLTLGKLCYIAGLITPIMIQLIYSTISDGLFLSFNNVVEYGFGNTISVMIVAFSLYHVFEFPFRRLIEYSLLPFVSHDDIYHLAYVRRKAAA